MTRRMADAEHRHRVDILRTAALAGETWQVAAERCGCGYRALRKWVDAQGGWDAAVPGAPRLRGSKRVPCDEPEIIRRYVAGEQTRQQIAASLGVSLSVVVRVLIRAGCVVSRQDRKEAAARRREEILALVRRGSTNAEISDALGVSVCLVTDTLRRAGQQGKRGVPRVPTAVSASRRDAKHAAIVEAWRGGLEPREIRETIGVTWQEIAEAISREAREHK